MPTPLVRQQAEAQAIYMKHLVAEAQKEALKKRDRLAFDSQGRVLIDVRLTPELTQQILDEINREPGNKFTELKDALGKQTTETTTVSLDINKNEVLKDAFHDKLKAALNTDSGKKAKKSTAASPEGLEAPLLAQSNPKTEEIINALDRTPKGSIIALQEEFHFHLALVSRLYKKVSPNVTDAQMKEIHTEAMKKVNNLVFDVYSRALKDAGIKEDGTIDIAKLNKSLDKARKEILPQAHNIMMQEFIRKTGHILKKKDFDKVKIKHEACATTATDNDILHVDQGQGLVTLIAGSKYTAHERIKGREFAHRQLIAHKIDENGDIEANGNPRIQIRTPSPVLKEGLASDLNYIADVAIKLNQIKKEYNLVTRLSGVADRKPKAFIYNSYTAFNFFAEDYNPRDENKQTQSAKHILRGAHAYNQSELRHKPDNPVFCFVQNISVNGFGSELGYNSKNSLSALLGLNSLREETTLMAEMALMHTLYDISPNEDRAIKDVFARYQNFLKTPNRPPFFSQSQLGKDAIDMIQEIKNNWKKISDRPESTDIVKNAQFGLRNLMAHDLHFKHEYSKLFQALSVFTEEASLGGCKSGNERAQAINGRVAVLDSLLNGNGNIDSVNVATALAELAKGKPDVTRAAQILKNTLDTAYNNANLQGAASKISLGDQSAGAKVMARAGDYNPRNLNTNRAEEASSVMTNLLQDKAGKMQAHKDLTKQILNTWGIPKTVGERMKSTFGSNTGAIVATFLGIGILAAIVHFIAGAIDNNSRQSKAAKSIAEVSGDISIKESYSSMAIPLEVSPEKARVALESSSVASRIIQNTNSTIPAVTHAGLASQSNKQSPQTIVHEPGHEEANPNTYSG